MYDVFFKYELLLKVFCLVIVRYWGGRRIPSSRNTAFYGITHSIPFTLIYLCKTSLICLAVNYQSVSV